MIVIFILLITIFVVPFFIYKRKVDDIDLNCDVNPYNRRVMKGEGFVVVDNILDETCRQKLVDTFLDKAKKNKNLNEDVKLNFYSNEQFLKQLFDRVFQRMFSTTSLIDNKAFFSWYEKDEPFIFDERPIC